MAGTEQKGIAEGRKTIEQVDCFGIEICTVAGKKKVRCNACGNEWFRYCFVNNLCGTDACPFFKTRKQHEEDVAKADAINRSKGIMPRYIEKGK